MSAPRDGPTAKTTDRMSTEHTPTERRRRLTTLLRMTGITKSFPGVLALRGAELELRARVAAARLLLARPALAVLDEPTSGLDATSSPVTNVSRSTLSHI